LCIHLIKTHKWFITECVYLNLFGNNKKIIDEYLILLNKVIRDWETIMLNDKLNDKLNNKLNDKLNDKLNNYLDFNLNSNLESINKFNWFNDEKIKDILNEIFNEICSANNKMFLYPNRLFPTEQISKILQNVIYDTNIYNSYIYVEQLCRLSHVVLFNPIIHGNWRTLFKSKLVLLLYRMNIIMKNE
jgi:hypothetical protein